LIERNVRTRSARMPLNGCLSTGKTRRRQKIDL
jgi:hypothetical protein